VLDPCLNPYLGLCRASLPLTGLSREGSSGPKHVEDRVAFKHILHSIG